MGQIKQAGIGSLPAGGVHRLATIPCCSGGVPFTADSQQGKLTEGVTDWVWSQ